MTEFGPKIPSPLGSVNPASFTSLQPSPSESNSKASMLPSLSESFNVLVSVVSCAPSLSASKKPASLTSILPSPFVSRASFPDSITSNIPSLSESKSIPFGTPSPSMSAMHGVTEPIIIPSS